MDAYVLLKILKYCSGSSARSYQCKFAIDQAFLNKSIESMEDVGAAIKEIIHVNTIRGKFSSIHPDLAAEGITRVEVEEKGLHFITTTETGSIYKEQFDTHVGSTFIFLDEANEDVLGSVPPNKDEEDRMERRALPMSLEKEEEEEKPFSIKG